MIVWDADDMGVNHTYSPEIQSHDCREKLDEFHMANLNFKATLFAIPAEMTYELLDWCDANRSWIELAVHGFTHSSNYECDKMEYLEFEKLMGKYGEMIDSYFVKGFKAPGWQISDDIYQWLLSHGWWVADQSYNNDRRPEELKAYINDNGRFYVSPDTEWNPLISGKHYHTWDCVGNGVYELSDQIKQDLASETEFKFISEIL